MTASRSAVFSMSKPWQVGATGHADYSSTKHESTGLCLGLSAFVAPVVYFSTYGVNGSRHRGGAKPQRKYTGSRPGLARSYQSDPGGEHPSDAGTAVLAW